MFTVSLMSIQGEKGFGGNGLEQQNKANINV
jgi:hypothetical protein